MRLLGRLALTLSLAAVALLLLLGWAQSRLYQSTRVEVLAETAVHRMESGGRERCEANPAAWPKPRGGPPGKAWGKRGGPRRNPGHHPHRPELFAYDMAFQSPNPRNPKFPPDLAEAIVQGEEIAVRRSRGGRDLELAVLMPWQEGSCAVLLLRQKGPPPWLSMATMVPAILSSLAVVLIALLAAGPIVRRIRRLTDEVKRLDGHGSRPIQVEGDDEIAELARAFEQSRQTIETQLQSLREREAALRDYIANTTHDVMSPLSVLQGHLVALQQRLEAGEPLPPTAIAPLLEEAHYLGSLLHNLNASARLQARNGLAHRDELELDRLVERVVERHRPIAERKGVALEVATPHSPVRFVGDLTLLEQALGNVVQNAIRYNAAQGHVAVVLDGDSAAWTLRVADDGPGIPESDRARVLEPEFRGSQARTRHPHGMGLGLHIAKSVAERHALGLELSQTPGGGLTVQFRYPA